MGLKWNSELILLPCLQVHLTNMYVFCKSVSHIIAIEFCHLDSVDTFKLGYLFNHCVLLKSLWNKFILFLKRFFLVIQYVKIQNKTKPPKYTLNIKV